MKHTIKQEGFGYFEDDTAITLEPGDFVDLIKYWRDYENNIFVYR